MVSCGNTKSDDKTPSLSDYVPKENQDAIIITMAIEESSADFWEDAVDEFNSLNNDYQIIIKNYVDSYDDDGMPNSYTTEEYFLADMEILQDVMNTDEIDIICNASFTNEVYYKILQNKGAFVDLYTFMENDAEVNTSTLNQHILSLNETEGKLYSLPTYYNVTTLMGENQYVGNKENWTVDDFMEQWKNMPEGSTINGSRYAEYIYYTILRGNLDSFIDYEKAEVNFNSAEFVNILEFCGNFPSCNGDKIDRNDEGSSFVNEIILSGIQSAVHFNGDYTMVGYPSADGKGAYLSAAGLCYSISAKSSAEEQEGAWEFIRTLFTKETQLENVIESYTEPDLYDGEPVWSSEFGFCINNEAFEQMAEDVVAQKYRQPDKFYMDKEVPYDPIFPTIKNVDKLRTYILSINRWEVGLDRSLWEIINEEVLAYFAGEKTLNETVDIIQNRASIWVSEQS